MSLLLNTGAKNTDKNSIDKAVVINAEHAGLIIGRGGENIRRIKGIYGLAGLRVTKNDETGETELSLRCNGNGNAGEHDKVRRCLAASPPSLCIPHTSVLLVVPCECMPLPYLDRRWRDSVPLRHVWGGAPIDG